MATAKQYDQAQQYLTEADARFRALDPHARDRASSHADTLELLASELDHRGHHAEAAQRRQQAGELRNATSQSAGQARPRQQIMIKVEEYPAESRSSWRYLRSRKL